MFIYAKRIISVLICVAVLLSLCSCKDGKSVIDTISNLGKTSEPASKDEIGFTIPYLRTDSLNPYKATSSANRSIANLMFDSLFSVNSDFEAVNVIAQSYTFSDKNLSITIKSGLKFSDGSALTSKDVVYSFELAKKGVVYASLLENVDTATVDGNNKVTFTLTNTNKDEVSNLTFPIIKENSDINSEEETTVSDEESDEGSTTQSNNSSKLPIGSGRYTLVTNSETKYLQFNPSRLGGYTPTYTKIGLNDVADTETLQSLFNLQRIDVYLDDFSNGEYTKFSKISGKIELTDFVFLGINSANSALSDPKVRRAIALSLDRTELASDSFAGCAVATSLPFHPSYGKLKNCTLPTIKSKTENAVSLLESVGFTKINDAGARYSDNKVLNFTLLVNSENEFRRSLARGIQQALESINIKITIKESSFSDYKSAIESETFDLYIGETELSNNFNLSRFFSDNGGLRYGINSKSESAIYYSDYTKGKVTMQRFIDSFSDELPFIPLAFREGITVSSDKIKTEIRTTPGNGYANIDEWTAQ